MRSTNQGKHIAYIGPNDTKTNGAVQTINKSRLWHWISDHPQVQQPYTVHWVHVYINRGVVRIIWTHHKHEIFANTAAAEVRERPVFFQHAATSTLHSDSQPTKLLPCCSCKNTQSCSCRLFFRTVRQGFTVISKTEEQNQQSNVHNSF